MGAVLRVPCTSGVSKENHKKPGAVPSKWKPCRVTALIATGSLSSSLWLGWILQKDMQEPPGPEDKQTLSLAQVWTDRIIRHWRWTWAKESCLTQKTIKNILRLVNVPRIHMGFLVTVGSRTAPPALIIKTHIIRIKIRITNNQNDQVQDHFYHQFSTNLPPSHPRLEKLCCGTIPCGTQELPWGISKAKWWRHMPRNDNGCIQIWTVILQTALHSPRFFKHIEYI